MSGGEGEPLRAATAFEVQRLAQQLSQAEYRLTRELGRVLAEGGSTVDQWRVLLLLADGASHPMSEIAEFALVPAPTLTRVIDRMVAENLAYRKADPRDRRRVLIRISARGRAKHQLLGQRVEDAMLPAPDVEAVTRLTELLARLVDQLR